MLTMRSFMSLERCDVPNIPDTVLTNQFEEWFGDRLRDSCSELSVTEVSALKTGTLDALLCPDCSTQAIKLTNPCKKTRFMLHSAAAWMGLRSYTKDGILHVVRYPIDDIAFISHDKAVARGAKKVFKHINKIVPRLRKTSFCNTCNTSDDVEDLYISVYHRGLFCDQCLQNGECETDPENCSKWECIRDLY